MSSTIFINNIKTELSKKIFGQHYMIDRLLIGLLSNGHILLEGVPGLAKTLTIKSLAQAIDAKFSRIQFTPDLLPADVTGSTIYNQIENKFDVRKGPIFGNFILADEINRAPAKVQSALLEAMQEKQVTIGEETFDLVANDAPFLVLATQNPLEQEGTYTLPEAQLDRFMLKVVVGYPTEEEEHKILQSQIQAQQSEAIKRVATIAEINTAKNEVKQVIVESKIEKYIIDIVFATRYPDKYNLKDIKPFIAYGASPRASINIALAAKAHAFLNNRNSVLPEDIKAIAIDVLRHRIGLNYDAKADGITTNVIIKKILDEKLPTP